MSLLHESNGFSRLFLPFFCTSPHEISFFFSPSFFRFHFIAKFGRRNGATC